MQTVTTPRHHMIDGQLEPNRILSDSIIAAMGVVERERFVPEAYRHCAYLDEAIPLNKNRYLLSPMTLGYLLQALQPKPGNKALVVGAVTGYSAVILHHLGCEVHALEESQDLANKARQILAGMQLSSIQVHTSSLMMGWMAAAPYDCILVEGGLERVPEQLTDQLSDCGVLAYVEICDSLPIERIGQGFVTTLRRERNRLIASREDGVSCPILPGAEKKESFRFE